MNNMPIKKANLFEWKEIKGLATSTGSLSKYFLNIIPLFLMVLPNLVPSMLAIDLNQNSISTPEAGQQESMPKYCPTFLVSLGSEIVM